jgi:N-acetylglutamate synthase-like GNAT family acetyltransferase
MNESEEEKDLIVEAKVVEYPIIMPFEGRHIDGIAKLIVPIQREEFGIPITYEDQPDLKDIADFYQRGAGNFWLALSGSRVVGTIALLDIGEGAGALRKMFVAADYRGTGRALANQLLAVLIDHARRFSLHVIYLGTTDKFLAAHRFYEKNNFTMVDPCDLPGSFPRMKVDSRFYRLAL